MQQYKQHGWSYLELLMATAIMSLSCIAIIQLQQRFFQQVQSDHWSMFAFMQLDSRFEYQLFEHSPKDDYLKHWQQQTQQLLPQAKMRTLENDFELSWFDKNQVGVASGKRGVQTDLILSPSLEGVG